MNSLTQINATIKQYNPVVRGCRVKIWYNIEIAKSSSKSSMLTDEGKKAVLFSSALFLWFAIRSVLYKTFLF